jgi:hypothetical protein
VTWHATKEHPIFSRRHKISVKFVAEFGLGFSKSHLENTRRFFLEYKDRVPGIAQSASGQLPQKAGRIRFLLEKSPAGEKRPIAEGNNLVKLVDQILRLERKDDGKAMEKR